MTSVSRFDRSGEVSREDVRRYLSDLLDIRRGEVPQAEDSPLGDPQFRAAIERKLAECPDCQRELEQLQELGAAFSEYSVGEKPPQDFADFGALVRQRMALERGHEAAEGSRPARNPQPRRAASLEPLAPSHRRHEYWSLCLSATAALLSLALLVKIVFPEWTLPRAPAKGLSMPATEPQGPQARADSKSGPSGTEHRAAAVAAASPALPGSLVPAVPVASGQAPRLAAPPLEGFRPGSAGDRGFLVPPGPLPERPLGGRLTYQVKAGAGDARDFSYDPQKDDLLEQLRELKQMLQANKQLTLAEGQARGAGEVAAERPLLGLAIDVASPAAQAPGALEGLQVSQVLGGSPAARTPIRPGDYITQISLPDGRELDGFTQSTDKEFMIFLHILRRLGAGKKVLLGYQRREGEQVVLRSALVTLGDYGEREAVPNPGPGPGR